MTDRASPGAKGSIAKNVEMGEIWGTLGWNKVIESDNPTRSAQESERIDETAFDEFDATYTDSSLTVTIEPGEAMVDGWVARDEPTDVTLDADTTAQSVYVGWDVSAFYDEEQHTDRDDADTVIIGTEEEFGDTDPKLELWTFDTDSTGVTNAEDDRNYLRPLGGVSFVSDDEPPADEDGLDWFDTGADTPSETYHVSEGGEWHSVPEQGEGSGLDADTVRDRQLTDEFDDHVSTASMHENLSEIHDGYDDLTQYRGRGNSVELIDISGSGVFLGAIATWDDMTVYWDVVVDGKEYTEIDTVRSSMSISKLPPIRFNNGLYVKVYEGPAAGRTISAEGWVKQ